MQQDQILNLNFHGIGRPIGRDFGRNERDYWVTPETFIATIHSCVGRDDISLSFDDGNWSDVEVALPLLQEHKLHATFFIVPSWLGEPGFISKQDLKELVAAGMTIGNHGLQHHDWTTLEPDKLEHDVAQGRRLLEELTGTEIHTVAIPSTPTTTWSSTRYAGRPTSTFTRATAAPPTPRPGCSRASTSRPTMTLPRLRALLEQL